MTDHTDLRLALGSYLAGALDAETRAAVQDHLDGCETCRAELAGLAPLPGFLGKLAPGEVDPGALSLPEGLLPGLIARARAIETRNRLRLRRWRVLNGVLGAATAAATAGDVTLIARPWGTQLLLSLRGLPTGTSCVAVVVGRDGHTDVVGDWGPTADHLARVEVATRMSTGSLAGVTIENAAGKPLLTAAVRDRAAT
jgi:predicted anti-sigma-YlaC factor YlaD